MRFILNINIEISAVPLASTLSPRCLESTVAVVFGLTAPPPSTWVVPLPVHRRKPLGKKMLRFYVPFGVIVYLIVSFVFLDGWPFREPPVSPNDGGGKESSQALGLNRNDGEAREPASPEVDDPPPARGREQEPQDRSSALIAGLRALEAKGGEPYRAALSRAVLNTSLPLDLRQALLPRLRAANRAVVFDPKGSLSSVDVRIKSGDNLTRIAQRVKKAHRNNVTPALIMMINRMKNDRIRAGAVLSVPTGSLSMVVHKSDYRLYVLLDETVILDYAVGLGRENSTPEGEFTIRGKTRRPSWTMPGGRVVPFGHPEHVIGNRWMGFATAQGRTSYGIHGTVDESSIGKSTSDGCIRMTKSAVEELFRLIPEGCPVRVRS